MADVVMRHDAFTKGKRMAGRLMIDRMNQQQHDEVKSHVGVSDYEVDEICDSIHAFLIREGQPFSSADIVRMAKAFGDNSADYAMEEFLELAEAGC